MKLNAMETRSAGDEGESIPGRVGRIRLLEVLGRGGMGEVYVGHDEKLGRKVAVKSLRRDRPLSAKARRRLLREARLLSRLNHPNVCQIYDIIEGEDGDFLVLELIEGRTLAEILVKPVKPAYGMRLAEQVAAALKTAHARGIVHRDLKPANVMVTPGDGVKILDFGVARIAEIEAGEPAADADPGSSQEDSERQKPGTGAFDLFSQTTQRDTADGFLGTPKFMSPEQARGEPATPASDMYSFGLILHELFTGRSPYGLGFSSRQLMVRVIGGRTEPASGLDADLQILIERLKSPAPTARPTAVDTAERLTWIRHKAWRRRRKLLAAVAMTATVLVALVTSFLTVRLARVAEDAAEQARLALSRQLAVQSTFYTKSRFDLALLLNVEAYRLADTLESRSALLAVPQAHPRLRSILRQDGNTTVLAADWSPDSKTLATIHTTGEVRLWDTEGALLGELVGHESYGWGLDWHPAGRVLATCGFDRTVRLWDVAARRPLGPPLTGHTRELWGLAWSGDGTRLASASEDGSLRLWDAAGHDLGVLVESDPPPWTVSWSGDDKLLATGDSAGQIHLWDARTGRRVGPPIEYSAPITHVSWSPAGDLLAIAGDRSVWLWDVARGARHGDKLVGHDSSVQFVAWNSDGTFLATAANDATVRLWETSTGLAHGRPLYGHGDRVTGVAWSGDDRFLASTSQDSTAIIWDVALDDFVGQDLIGHQATAHGLEMSPDGRTLASASNDMFVVLWDLESGRPRHRLRHSGAVMGAAWSHDGRSLAAVDDGWNVWIWDAASGEARIGPLRDHGSVVDAVAWSGDDRIVASAGWDATIRFWDADTGRLLQVLSSESASPLRTLEWHPTKNVLVAGDEDGVLSFWDGATGAFLRGQPAHDGIVNDVAWSGDGTILASAGHDHVVAFWDDATGKRLRDDEGREIGPSHISRAKTLAWNADGTLLASGGYDHHLIVWDARTLTPRLRLTDLEAAVMAVAWIGDTRIASTGPDGVIQFRDIAGGPESWVAESCRLAGRNLTADEWQRFFGDDIPQHATCPEFAPATGK